MDFLMTTGAQAPQIALVICAAISEWLHMMHQRCHRRSPQPKTLFAEWMRRDVAVADSLPRTSISLVLIVATGEMLVVPLHQAPMFLAVTAPAVGQIGTAAVWFHWHWLHLDFGHEKTSAGIAPIGGVRSYFSMIQNTMSRG